IQILIYWFVFGTLRNREPVEVNGIEVPFFIWLLAGFFLWIFSFQSMIEGSKSIYTRLKMLSKMSFPFSVIPNFVIFSKFFIHILIYWFVFGTLRNREPVEVNGIEVPFFIWLLAGFFLWIFSFQSMIEGSKSIYTRLKMLSKMSFPFSVIPNFVIFSKFYIHIFMLAITIIILQFNGFYISIYYVQLI